MSVTVDIGIACSASQSFEWWQPVMVNLMKEMQRGIEINQVIAIGSALPDSNKSNIIHANLPAFDRELYEQRQRGSLTDANRDVVAYGFMNGGKSGRKAEWIFWMDDDTVPPDGALSKLLASGKKFVAGLYFLARAPYNPIAYIRDAKDKWGYRCLYGYTPGSLFEVDSVGMGCTLIHRSVYEAIMEQHQVFVRPNGSLMPVHRSKIHVSQDPLETDREDETVLDGYLTQKLLPLDPDDNRAWPFYAMEYIRTEDHYFCELAAASGFKPWIESTVTCEHIKPGHVTYENYRAEVNKKNGL